jgi:hypothetical protein
MTARAFLWKYSLNLHEHFFDPAGLTFSGAMPIQHRLRLCLRNTCIFPTMYAFETFSPFWQAVPRCAMSFIRLLLRYRSDDECRGCISDLKIISDLKSFLHTLESLLTCHSFAADKPHDIITSTSNFGLQRRRLEGKKVKSPQCGQAGSGHINGGPHNA